MNTYNYTIQSTPAATSKTDITKTIALTGTTDVTFSLSGLSAYDASIADPAANAAYRINKVIVDLDDDRQNELIFNRILSDTEITSLSTTTFKHVFETQFTDKAEHDIYITIQRDDSIIDVITVKVTSHRAALETYENINLIKTDYFNDENDEDEKVLVTFINKNPEVLGINLLDLKADYITEYDPLSSISQELSSNAFNVGFTTEYVQVHASDSSTNDAIIVKLDPKTGMLKNHGNVALKYRTRAADPDLGEINLPSNPLLFYIPLTANSGFIHLSGYLNWNCGDLLKDVNLSDKYISIPLTDITGVKTDLVDYYFTNVNTGAGTSATGLVSGGYFLVDIYDPS